MFRIAKTVMVATIALFFVFAAFTNITDYQTNFNFVKHVLSMDTTFHSSHVMWRRITNSTIQTAAYWLIISWEAATGIILSVAACKIQSQQKNSLAILGLTMGFCLYILGFVVIGGEWFCMWESKQFNGQTTAILFSCIILLVLLFVASERNSES